jgi:hypothetical protein
MAPFINRNYYDYRLIKGKRVKTGFEFEPYSKEMLVDDKIIHHIG